jgi:hypothetical protein
VSDLLIDGETVDEVRYDERFWGMEPTRPPYPQGNWTKGIAKQSSVWWPVEPDAAPATVECTLLTTESMPVAIGGPGSLEPVQVGPLGVEITRSTGAPVRIMNSAGGGLYAGWFGGDRGFMEPDLGQFDQPAEVFSWCGGAVLLSADYLRDVGIFDDSYFLYYEDFDLSWRGRSLGWTYRYVPTSVVYHEHAYSSKAGSAFFTFWVDRNRRLTLVKNAPVNVAVRACVGAFRGMVMHLVRHTYTRLRHFRPPSPHTFKEQINNFRSFAGAVPGALRARGEINRRRAVSHRAIEAWTVTK